MLSWSVDESGVTLTPTPAGGGRLLGLLRRDEAPTLDDRAARDDRLAAALGEIEATAEELGEAVQIMPERIRLSHQLVATLPTWAAKALSLRPLVHLTFSVDAKGVPERPGFRPVTEWRAHGRRVLPQHTGAILYAGEGPRRLPLRILEAIEEAEGLTLDTGSEESPWAALARFRAALNPALGSGDPAAARLAITVFLRALEVRLADSLGLASRGEAEFDVLPFDRRNIMRAVKDASIEDEEAELAETLRLFRRSCVGAGRLSPIG